MKNFRLRLQFLLMAMLLPLMMSAQEIRYVKVNGTGAKNGYSWDNAFAQIQDAINDLVNNNKTGEVWVAAGTYYPTESTESSSSPLYKAFKIPAGITVRGGFKPNLTASDDGKNTATERPLQNDKNFGTAGTNSGNLDGEGAKSGVYQYKTILCGDLTPGKAARLTWNAAKSQFDATFYGNTYHVVWFAMNGFTNGRANPLSKPAKLEGCVVEGGHAYSHNVNDAHPHEGYGGGIYMVANSFVYNCEVKNCDASRNGGGIYMDGGGIVRRTYVHDCQALGVGTEYGLGGGVCENGASHNSKANPIVVAQSAVTNCVGRMGGGMALLADQTQGNNKYAVVANSTLVNNNTAQVEAGGVYTYKGGGLASMTIVRNKCNGSGIVQNDVATGRAGGVFNHDATYIGNTVIWGNQCAANNDVQYASSRSNLVDDEKSHFYYNAVSKMDNTDWSGTTRMGVLSLDDANNTTGEKGTKGYPLFLSPTATAGYLATIDTDAEVNWTKWVVSSESFLTFAGIATADLDYEGLTPAPTGKNWDMQFGEFNSRPTIGAFVSMTATVAPAENITYNDVAYAKAYFVDPDFIYANDNAGSNGASWEHPIRFLGNALDEVKAKNYDPSTTKVAIFVKEGTVENIRAAAGGTRVRVTSLDIPSNVSIFGSFSSTLTGTMVEKPNVVRTPTIISAKLMDAYKYNVAHLININNKQNIVVDGFKITYANASSTELSNDNADGAAITLKNCAKVGGNTTILFRNIIVSNCTADHGAAVYADNAAVVFENCIFHNNTSKTITNSGIVYATNGSALTFNHCDVLRNVGHASYLGSNNATNVWKNTIFYGNMDRTMPDTNEDMGGGISHALAAFSGNTANASGDHCMFDANSVSFASMFGGGSIANGGDTGNKWQYNLQYLFRDGAGQGYPRFINPTKNAGVTEDGDQTYYGRATSFEPHNNNPIVNVAAASGAVGTWGKDIINITRDYGGLPDIGAVENHEADKKIEGENAYTDGQKKIGDVLYVRDYTPATGTKIDTYDLTGPSTYTKNNDGKGIYRHTASGSGEYELLDGSSWERAINGNANYSLSGTRTYKDVNNQRVLAYRINNNNYYLDVNNGTLHRVKSGTVTDPETSETYNPADRATVFILCDATGKEILFDAGKTPKDGARLKDATTGEYLYLDYSYGTYTFRTSANPPAAQAKATIAASSTNFTIYYKANGQTKYLSNADVIPSSTKTAWTFSDKETEIDFGDGAQHNNEAYDMGTFTGLQYAVNKQNIAYKDEASLTGDKIKAKKQIWVAAGLYKRNPAKNTSTTPSTPIVDMDEENCFIIQDGVDVYGAFPKTGNPGKDQRQALISQYVNNGASTYSYTDFETILEPATTGVASGVKRRVLGQPYKYNPDKGNDTNRGKNSGILYCGIDYIGVVWDGFTLRNGVWDSKGLNRPNRYGGAGAAIYRNVTLKNAVVTDNTTIYTGNTASQDFRAGGVYLDGGIIDACYVINNTIEGWYNGARAQYGAAYGGGMYIYTGTVFNSVIANNINYSKYADGAGAFIENANFFNNTIVNNVAESVTGTIRASGGIAVWTDPGRGTDSQLTLYNCIIAGNVGSKASALGNADVCLPREGLIELHNCISTSTTDVSNTASKQSSIKFVNCGAPITDYATIFNAYNAYGTADKTFKDLNLRLKPTATRAINTGVESPVIGGAVYNLIDYNDMDFAERIQDCNIDIGAYEFNGATSIAPETIGNQAIYYVTPEGYGTTDAHDPANAACAEKLQRVLDAAGRYKYLNPTMQVIVKVANSYDLLHPKNIDSEGHDIPSTDERYVYPEDFKYYATRTTDWTDQDVRVWSIIVPRGVEVWGGYSDVASDNTHGSWTNTNNGFTRAATSADVTAGKATAVDQQIDNRNITKNPTYFDSYYLNKLEKTSTNTYHVVSFTDRLFDLNGYAYTTNDFNGKTADQIRTILQNGSASTFLQLLDNDESHFVHMSDAIAGVSTGVTGNVILDGSAPKNFGTAETPKYASNRAVIDGIFVSGGKADAPANSTNTTVNINSYGGAAFVNDYAYVRNCILTGNTATNGGALALADNALVSGCLILDNVATNNGGGIYVFEEGTKLSNGTTIRSLQQDGDPTMDYRMAHVLTSTIVRNTAQRGGGVWYNDKLGNVRFNSVAIWQNIAPEQANVYGSVNPEQPTEDETISEVFYPFSYSAIQNIRASGTNNLDIGGENHQGARFVDKAHDVGQGSVDQTDMAEEGSDAATKYNEFGYYGLTEYSLLCSNGMPKNMYNQMKAAIAISDDDILGTNRMPTDEDNIFVEIGARALEMLMPKKQLMLRLFVADPMYVDTETAVRFMRLRNGATGGSKEEYYSQVGSSFAYPFNSLQNALDYVKRARNGKIIAGNYDAQNLPFEILVGKGEYYPKQSLNSETQNIWAATFAIPEGVTIMGGFNPQGGAGTYYGRYYEKDATKLSSFTEGSIFDNVKLLSTVTSHVDPSATEIGRGNYYGTESVYLPASTGEAKSITFQQWHIQDIADRRGMSDNNKNGIIEPWEFTNQTIISGNAVNGETDGVYHIMTAVADADAVGLMPKVQSTNSAFVGSSIAEETGYQWKEMGQQIRLNGLIVTGGNALTYLSTALDEYGSYMFYHGAGLLVDGNRYKTTLGGSDTPAFHNSAAYGVGYRDIPVSVTNCQFRNNIAGYGGAISTNGSLSLFGSSFEQNMAIGQTEKPESGEHWYTNISGTQQEVTEVAYPGHGGAIHVTNQLSAFNTLFANNEARLADGEEKTIGLVQHPTFRVPVEANASATLRAAGGAIMMGSAAQHHIVNCNFVRNKANAYPAVFTMNPATQQADNVNTHDYSQIINTVAWGNEVNPDMLAKYAGNAAYLTASKLMVNIGKKGRTQNYITSKSAADFYNPAFVAGNVPTAADLIVADPNAGGNDTWQEAVWFCAYEDGVGFKPNNTNDLREPINYTANRFAPTMIKGANGNVYQNCNILIVADNNDVAGPNFGNPSVKAGCEGFMEGADWSPARFNRLTDNGNGWITQSVDAATLNVTFPAATFDADKKPTNFQGAYSYTHYISDIVTGNPFPEYKLWMAIGNEKYMQATDEQVSGLSINGTSLGTTQKNYPRISPDPTMGVTKAYIDIGVYEYVKQPLLKPGSEVDILWVSTKEKPENGPADGTKWSTPTSNLQAAINTLLSSRNGHKKEIRIMEGEYTPVTAQIVGGNKYNAFVIDTKSLNGSAIVPSRYTEDSHKENYYAQSLTIKGGYSSEIPFEYNPQLYKTTIRQNEAVDGVSTDKLIYIVDPTVRYYYENATGYSTNNDGATFVGTGECTAVRTMPIQIDGVTLINDKVKAAGTNGSAIYYPDYDGSSAPQANVVGSHSISVGGTVTYYTDAEHHTPSPDNVVTDYPSVTDATTLVTPAKLLINKTLIVGSGKTVDDNKETASAVYIGKKGGSALIYNTVFHSNYGMPLDAYNTVNVNNTFGKNAGMVKLQDVADVAVNSAMHNSVMWMNNGGNAQFSIPNVSVVTTEGDTKGNVSGSGIANFTYNSFTGGNTALKTDVEVAANKYNTGLVTTNNDIADGPNFVDPDNADIESRNFDIKPSLRLLNKGMDTNITDATLTGGDGTGTNQGNYYTLVVSQKNDYSLSSSFDNDVLFRTRLNRPRIDIGAYEFQGKMYQILYVDPNKAHNDAATGENWENSFGYGDLQSAMDLAAVYHLANPSQEAYVFTKGASSTNKDLNTNETLTIHDGVTTYGSIISGYTDWHEMKKEDGTTPKYATIDAFIENMLSQREGIASNAASKTVVTGIKASSAESFSGATTPAVVDGYVVTAPGKATAPVVDVTNPSQNAVIVLRNIIVADNDFSTAADGTNVAQISNGLLYEALLRDNKQATNGATLRVDKGANYAGYAVNVTVEGKTIAADGSTPAADADGGNIYNSIINSINSGSGANAAGGNAPYKTITNKHISGYFYNIADPNLNYQLTETSKYIDQCVTTNPLTGVADNLAPFINYTTDRDLLGNPRLLTGVTSADASKIDRGAFETWKVQNSLNGFTCGDQGTINSAAYSGTYGTGHDIIKKHFYPHDGSVVYIMEKQSLVIDGFDPAHEVKPTPHNPGFMLVQEGANFYGNGRPATCAYLAIERKVRKGTGSIVSIPYAMQYNENVSKPKYVTTSGSSYLDNLDTNVGTGAYEYNGLNRSDWQYIFKAENSGCWNSIANNAVTAANHGVLYQARDNAFDGDATEVTLRFTGKGNGLTDYVYTETTDVFKNVVLTKYDDAESTNSGADYTDDKDMGWNCFGMPYLVSDYKPYEQVNPTTAATVTGNASAPYRMNIPHTLWLYYDGVHDANNQNVNGNGGYYSVKSWSPAYTDWRLADTATPAIWVGEGIFTQTATNADSETLTFYRPVAPTTFQPSSSKRYYVDLTNGIETAEQMSGDSELIATEYYTVGGVRINKAERGSVTLVRKIYSNGAVKTQKVYIK